MLSCMTFNGCFVLFNTSFYFNKKHNREPIISCERGSTFIKPLSQCVPSAVEQALSGGGGGQVWKVCVPQVTEFTQVQLTPERRRLQLLLQKQEVESKLCWLLKNLSWWVQTGTPGTTQAHQCQRWSVKRRHFGQSTRRKQGPEPDEQSRLNQPPWLPSVPGAKNRWIVPAWLSARLFGRSNGLDSSAVTFGSSEGNT